MTYVWGEREPNARHMTVKEGDGGMLIVGKPGVGDPVNFPGVGPKIIREVVTAPCPKCRADVTHYFLDDRYGVADCSVDKFLWYRAREEGAPQKPEASTAEPRER